MNKSETLRLTLEGQDYLDFHQAVARLYFNDGRLSQRQENEFALKLAVGVLCRSINQLALTSQSPFLKADVDTLFPAQSTSVEAVANETKVDYKTLYFDLVNIIKKANNHFDQVAEVMPKPVWEKILEGAGLNEVANENISDN